MDPRDRETFLDSITKSSLSQEFSHLSVDDPRGKLEEELLLARGRAEALRALVRLTSNDDFQKWLEARSVSDNLSLRNMIRATTFDAFTHGKVCGRLDLILELRTQKIVLERALTKIQAEITDIEKRLKE